MALTSMKLSKKDSKREFAIDDSGPKFPHGLVINLGTSELEKLGFDSLPEVGTKFRVVGVGPVTHASERRNQQNVSRDISIQIEKIDLSPEGTAVDAVERGIKEANK